MVEYTVLLTQCFSIISNPPNDELDSVFFLHEEHANSADPFSITLDLGLTFLSLVQRIPRCNFGPEVERWDIPPDVSGRIGNISDVGLGVEEDPRSLHVTFGGKFLHIV